MFGDYFSRRVGLPRPVSLGLSLFPLSVSDALLSQMTLLRGPQSLTEAIAAFFGPCSIDGPQLRVGFPTSPPFSLPKLVCHLPPLLEFELV